MTVQSEASRATHALLDLIDALLESHTGYEGSIEDNHRHRALDGKTVGCLESIKARLEVHTTGDAGMLANHHADHGYR